MEGLSTDQAFARIEVALARIEAAAARAPDAALAGKHEQLREAVATSLREIDALIAGGDR